LNKKKKGIPNNIVEEYGEERFVSEIQNALRNGKYHPQPARRKEIPKQDGKMRPLGIPVILDRVVQMDEDGTGANL